MSTIYVEVTIPVGGNIRESVDEMKDLSATLNGIRIKSVFNDIVFFVDSETNVFDIVSSLLLDWHMNAIFGSYRALNKHGESVDISELSPDELLDELLSSIKCLEKCYDAKNTDKNKIIEDWIEGKWNYIY